MHENDPFLYVAVVKQPADPKSMNEIDACFRVSDDMYLIRSDLSQSKLYHALKRRLQPTSLFVGRLTGHPKFKGMEPGSLKWLRTGQEQQSRS